MGRIHRQPGPTRQYLRGRGVGNGSSGGRACSGQVNLAERSEMQARGTGGRDTYLSCAPSCRRCRTLKKRCLEVGAKIRRPGAGAGTQSGIAKGIEFSQPYCLRCATPWLLTTLPPRSPRGSSTFPRAVHVHRPPYAACVRKRGVGPCARCRGRGAPGLSNARSPTRFIRPGARSPCSAGTPFAVTGGHLALF